MTHSGPSTEPLAMRTAGITIACLLSAAATGAAAEPAAALNVPPFPGTAPSAAPEIHALAATGGRVRAEGLRPPHGRTCFSQAETREKIAQRRLTDPVNAMRAGRAEGEALRTRLCRWKQDELVYEVFVLRRDGRIVRLYMNAQNGQAVLATDPADHK